jgi:glycosyltransferase involved in cell wall biosynthesis
MSRVDVIIPCYNYGRFLGRCVQSVLSQTEVEVKALVLDDASMDETAEIAAAMAARDKRVQFRRHATNCGHIATYNEGFEWATSEFLLLLSADDLLTPGALGRAVRLMDQNPEVGLACGRQIVFQSEDQLDAIVPNLSAPGVRLLTGPEFLHSVCQSGANSVATPTAVVRTQLQKELGGYRKELPHTADLETWLRLATRGSVGILDADQAFKRMHGRNMQREFLDGVRADLEQRAAAFRLFFRGEGHRVSDTERLEGLANLQLAREAFWAACQAFDAGDLGQCQELLDLALQLDSAIQSTPEWSRLRWKRRLGPRLWSVLRPVADGLRGRALAGRS